MKKGIKVLLGLIFYCIIVSLIGFNSAGLLGVFCNLSSFIIGIVSGSIIQIYMDELKKEIDEND